MTTDNGYHPENHYRILLPDIPKSLDPAELQAAVRNRSKKTSPLRLTIEPSPTPVRQPITLVVSAVDADSGIPVVGDVRIDGKKVGRTYDQVICKIASDESRGEVVAPGYTHNTLIPFEFEATPPPPPPQASQVTAVSAPPSPAVVERSYPASVTMKNTGTNTWTAGGTNPYLLGAVGDTTRWGPGRVGLPSDVPPGQEVRFDFTVTPKEVGSHDFSWQMLQENVAWFGEPTHAPVEVVRLQMTVSVQPEVTPLASETTVTIVAKDAQGGADVAGTAVITNYDSNGNTVTLTKPTNTPFQATFRGKRIGPPEPDFLEPDGTVTATGYAEAAIPFVFEATPPPPPAQASQVTAVSAPPSPAVVERSYPASVTMKNTGTNTWTAGGTNPYLLGAVGDTTRWGPGRVGLPSDVSPGQEVRFDFTVTPKEVGSHDFSWQMLQENVAWFGEPTHAPVEVVRLQMTVRVQPEVTPLASETTVTIVAKDAQSGADVAGTAVITNYDSNGNTVTLTKPTNTPFQATFRGKTIRDPDGGIDFVEPTGTVTATGYTRADIPFVFA